MADQIVITEKTSQAKDVRAAVGSRYGDILPAEGHLLDLLEPEDVVPAWKRWSPILLRPEGLYGTRPAEGGNKAAIDDLLVTRDGRDPYAVLSIGGFLGIGTHLVVVLDLSAARERLAVRLCLADACDPRRA